MSRMRFKWNRNALYEVRSMAAPAVNEQLRRIADRANSMSSGTFEWESHQGARAPQGRWRGTVYPTDWRARRDQANDNVLLRALGG